MLKKVYLLLSIHQGKLYLRPHATHTTTCHHTPKTEHGVRFLPHAIKNLGVW